LLLPLPSWRYVMWRDVHHPLWPLIGPVGWVDRDDDFPWNDSADAVAAFATTVEVMSPVRAEMAAHDVRLRSQSLKQHIEPEVWESLCN
jgi:hypothetical protein